MVEEWLSNYKANNTIEGWVNDGVYDFLYIMNRILNDSERPVPGGALEIGVHHGKFFIPLNALVSGVETKSVAIDLFEKQNLNVDFSGYGDRIKFQNNLKMYDRFKGENVIIDACDSTIVKSDYILKLAGGPFKIVSVDGGHTAEHAISDICLAHSVLHPYGFVIVDDILNSHWLGVIDGVTTYLRGRPTLWPLAIGYNKLIMCGMSIHPEYERKFAEWMKFSKVTTLCGYDILSV